MNAYSNKNILRSLIAGAFLLFAEGLGAQPRPVETDLNEYYRFPFAVGAEYRTLQAFSGFASSFVVREIASELRLPLPFLPILQPFVRAGNVSYVRTGSTGAEAWDHTDWFGALGLAFASRFSKNFEIGADVSGGASQSYYEHLDPLAVTGDLSWFVDAGARIGLIPSYNFSVDIRPSIRYSRTLGPLTEFDGVAFGVGFSVSYRFGQDPDSPASAVRAFRLSGGKLPPVFSAMQSYYASNAIGTLKLVNEDRAELSNVEVSFFQSGYMDAPTPVASIDSVAARGTIDIPLIAAFNQEVFKTEGITPLVGELIVKYRERGKSAEQRFPLSYELMDRTSIIWDDDRKVGAFITPSDSALRNYGSYVRQTLKADALSQLNEPLQTAAQIYAALGKIGMIYQADPTTPFVKAQAGQISIDSVNLARSTLQRGTGDCDDLTVLFASILESIGVETGFITVPGHIYPAFNTKLTPREYRELHPNRSLSVVVDGELWVPVEITLIGRQGFADAWRKGAELWTLYDRDSSKRSFIRTAAAQQVYRPVALRESDLGLQYGSKEDLQAVYRAEMARLADSSLGELAEAAKKSGDKRDYNALGVAGAMFGKLKEAETAFQRAIKIDPLFTNAQVNLGNVAFLQKDFKKALASFQAAASSLLTQGKGTGLVAQKVLINVSKAHNALANYSEAKNAFDKATAIDPQRVRDFAYLAQVGAGSGSVNRAAEQKNDVLFLGDE
ncbi:MAG: hypothetical protein WCT14_12260 [Treponemataceae bacterium]